MSYGQPPEDAIAIYREGSLKKEGSLNGVPITSEVLIKGAQYDSLNSIQKQLLHDHVFSFIEGQLPKENKLLSASLSGVIDKVILPKQIKERFLLGMMIGIKDASINSWETLKYIYNNPRETAEAIGELAYNLLMYYDTRDIKYIYPISIPLGYALHDKIQKEVTRFN